MFIDVSHDAFYFFAWMEILFYHRYYNGYYYNSVISFCMVG